MQSFCRKGKYSGLIMQPCSLSYVPLLAKDEDRDALPDPVDVDRRWGGVVTLIFRHALV